MITGLSGAKPGKLLVLIFSARPPPNMRITLITILAAALLAGCGYKGPLYLPKPKPVAQKPSPRPAPAQDDVKPAGDPEQPNPDAGIPDPERGTKPQ